MNQPTFSLLNHNPFGMLTPCRNWSAGSEYRFGFNGKESDDETYGEGNAYDFGARIYDPRLGRWLNTDPLEKRHANNSPYLSMGNNPILFIDKEGEDIYIYYVNQDKQITVAQIASNLEIEIKLVSELVPKEFANLVTSKGWNPISYDGDLFNHLPVSNGSLWGNFKSDAKMLTLAFSGTALIQGQFEIDIISINPQAKSEDAGKTFAYFTSGLGFGITSTGVGWGVTGAKGNVDFNEESGTDLDRDTFKGFSFTKSWEVYLGKTNVYSYGCECPEYMYFNDRSKSVYSAEMRSLTFSDGPPGSASTIETKSFLIGEVDIKARDIAKSTISSGTSTPEN